MKQILFLPLLCILLVACPVQEEAAPAQAAKASLTIDDKDRIEAELQALLAQTNIDPISRYIETHQTDAAYQAAIQQLRKERKKRCAEVEKIYAGREKNSANLDRLQKAYQYSCPQLVADFARLVATASLSPIDNPAASSSVDACAAAYAKPDYAAALEHCRPPAEQGNPQAQLKLGIMYADGRGISKNPVEAYVWFSLAVQGGIQQAQVLRSSIAKSLTTEELVQANDRVVKLTNQFQ